MTKIVTRDGALAAGLKTYFTGVPCRFGHMSVRGTSSRHCYACGLEREKKRRITHAKHVREVNRAYRIRNADRIKRQKAEHYQRHKEDSARRRRKRAKEKPEETALYMKQYRQANQEAVRANEALYRQNNKERCRINRIRRRAAQRASKGGHTVADLRDIARMQKNKCAYCRTPLKSDGAENQHNQRTVDHIIPLSRGGGNDRRNLQLLCRRCNSQKRAEHPVDFARKSGRLL